MLDIDARLISQLDTGFLSIIELCRAALLSKAGI